MNNRGLLLKQPRDSGISWRWVNIPKMDEISFDMQFIDIANWEELDKRR
ncbi:MAG: hypothetical protein CM1200mP10_20100 [Candidatus Neomarinimicrobiota bacterium]|nr:MAG: hypothetical protein CM1200mP10_20100 [Candidatus Neomarinimicrobiota bacterium]